MKTMPPKQWYDVKDVAALLDVSPQCVRNWVKQGRIPGASKFGPKMYRFSKVAIEAWIESRRVTTN